MTTTGNATSFPTGGFSPRGIAAGPDGNLWLVDSVNGGAAAVPDKISRLSTTGVVTSFSTGISSGIKGSSPDKIVSGPDGNLWFLQYPYGHIFRATPTGAITEFNNTFALSQKAVAGPDGALWFASGSNIVRITRDGVLSSFSPPGLGNATGIASGPDGNIWVTDSTKNAIGRMTITGVYTAYSDGISPNASPQDITAGPDGNLWFTEWSLDRIGRITPAGLVTEFSAGMTAKSGPRTIIAGPDGNLWFTMRSGTSSWSLDANGKATNVVNRNSIGRITPNGVITEFGVDVLNNAGLNAITVGPDSNLWFTEENADSNRIGRITPAGVITEFKMTGLAADAGLSSITSGPDKKLWFTEKNANKIGNFTPP